MVPAKYNLRNLRVRWVTTLMTVLGTGLVVWATVLTFGLTDGLDFALRTSGQPLDLIVLRKGSNDETGSTIEADTARQIATLEGIDTDSSGRTLSSIEYSTILTKPRRGNAGTTNLIVRGLDDVGRALRPDFKIVEGRDLKPGLNEAITSRNMAQRFENCAIGEKLEINQVDFTIVGYFEAGGSSAESEVWTAIADLTGARRQAGAVTSVNLRAQDEQALASLKTRISENDQFNLQAVTEPEYYEKQMSSSIAIKFIGYTIATFLTFGAMFAAANTMYAAVASRGREIGTLRAIGFKRRSILASFLFESVVLCLLGGLLGCLATLPFNGLSTGTANWATFSEITFMFRFGPWVLARGVLMALIMGLLGGIFPAIRAVRLNIIDALRER
ncbi:MAG: ABC transporter permease [Planctomycetaceae bacterium]